MSNQIGPYNHRLNTSQPTVVTRIQKAVSRYQVSDFWLLTRVDSNDFERDSKSSMDVYVSPKFESWAVERSSVSWAYCERLSSD